ncbi:MAG: zinc ribbon domain-containing protein [Promethearchaeota archaeon]
MKCPKCQFRSRKGEKFCGRCGTQLILVCPSCGFENLPDYKFCGECGLNFSTRKRPRPLPWMAKMTTVKGRETESPRALQKAEVRPRGEEKLPRPPDITGEPTAAATEEKTEVREKRAEAEELADKIRGETEEVMEPEDISVGEEVLPTVSGISFWNKFDLGVIGLLSLILMVICYADARSLLGKPFTGFQLLKNRAVVGGLESGMKPFDLIEAVDGKEVKSSPEIMEIVRSVPLGTTLHYTVNRKDEVVNVPVKTRLFSPQGFFWTIAIPFTIGIGYLLIGMITFITQSAEKYRLIFLVLCTTVFIARITNFDFYSTHRFTELFLFCWVLMPGIFFHLGFTYPEEKEFIKNRRWLISLPYYVAVILFIVLMAFFYSPTEELVLFVMAIFSYFTLSFVVLLISLAHSSLRASSPINRMRAKVVFLGSCGSLIPIFSILISYLFRVNLGVFAVTSQAFSLLFPFTLGYAMIRHQLFGEGSEAPTSGTYKCSSCGNEIVLRKSQRIPVCGICGAGGAALLWYRVIWKIVGV